ncbi:MAG: general secretion pathway protein GspB [Xanthomonadaceae bacterium]|nr:general secretion pathway protein GspB [Xanthomonadaceae bacterium]
MSLILEALRRSEAQRRRGSPPGLHSATTDVPPPRSGSRRAVLALLAGLGLLLVLLAVHRASAPDTAGTAPAPETPVMPTGTASPATPPRPAAPAPAPPPAMVGALPPAATALARELDAGAMPVPPTEAAVPAPAPTPTPTPAPAPAPPASMPAVSAPPPAAMPAGPAAAGDALPLDRLDAASRAMLPPLRVSMHVYDPDPARRFVLVDGRRVREGETLAPGLQLVAIEQDGLRLDWRGRLLHLPR